MDVDWLPTIVKVNDNPDEQKQAVGKNLKYRLLELQREVDNLEGRGP